MTLYDIKNKEKCIFVDYTGSNSLLKKRLENLGFVKGSNIYIENKNIFKDITVVLNGRTVAIQKNLQKEIKVIKCE